MSNFRSGSAGAALVGEEAEREALRWAGPFGYAVLQVLRMGDHYSDADFLALLERGRREMGASAAVATSGYEVVQPASPPTPSASQPVAGLVLDPPPDASHYRPPSTGRGGQPAAPPGRRDASGRSIRRAR